MIRLPIIVLLPVRGWRRTCWRIIFPSSSILNPVVVLLETFKSLSMTLSCLICWMDWTFSFAGAFNVVFVQLTIRVLRLTKIRALPHRTLFSFFVYNNVPVSSPIVAFLQVYLHRNGLPMQVRRIVWFVLVSIHVQTHSRDFVRPETTFQEQFGNDHSLHLWPSQHITFFVIHSLTQWLTMPSTAWLVLLYYVSSDRQCVKFVFVEKSTLFL